MNGRYRFKFSHFCLILATILVSVYGIVVLGSAQESLQRTQVMGLLIGVVAMLIVAFIDYVWILNFYWLAYAGALVLLLYVRFFGDTTYGAQRWIDLGFFRFQPSEICKIILIVFFAKFFSERQERMDKLSLVGESLVLIGVPLFLILKQPDLSTAIVVATVFASMIFMANLSKRLVLISMAVVVPLVAGLLVFAANTVPGETFLPKYQHTRIVAWLDPEEYKTEEAMQQQNSIVAIGSGQLKGKGLNNDEVASLKNGNFVPEPQTDFIFAVVGEELGFVGCCALILLLLWIVIMCFVIGRNAPDISGRLICCGIGSLIGAQSLINIAVTTGFCPNTGLTLPFMSYGLTSLISLFIGIGFVLNVGMHPQKYERQVKFV